MGSVVDNTPARPWKPPPGVLRRALDRRGRVAVVTTATVRGANGRRKVRKRIVLHTTLIRNGKRISYR